MSDQAMVDALTSAERGRGRMARSAGAVAPGYYIPGISDVGSTESVDSVPPTGGLGTNVPETLPDIPAGMPQAPIDYGPPVGAEVAHVPVENEMPKLVEVYRGGVKTITFPWSQSRNAEKSAMYQGYNVMYHDADEWFTALNYVKDRPITFAARMERIRAQQRGEL